ncbi:hypothetical protein [Bacillus sp. PK3_68]|uniref:hypothetical protein n=1 Tax=Bacillus sp. PK3_68 TaxID=2027408 RepID=UPI000E7264B6|nr:hypothetical protein [Bacillus sp. PK3_68]RJS58786.1 hypothetical protein CJ483_00785 [Bacillus sp. PK3_68]
MYTYDSFETMGAFTLLRPVFITLIVAMLFLFLIALLPSLRRKVHHLFVMGGSVVLVIVSAQLLYYDAIIVDELGLGGDEITTYLFLIIVIFSVMNSIIFYVGQKRSER